MATLTYNRANSFITQNAIILNNIHNMFKNNKSKSEKMQLINGNNTILSKRTKTNSNRNELEIKAK
jgi:hypothetical protein